MRSTIREYLKEGTIGIVAVIVLFLIVKVVMLFYHQDIYWDEAVYISMGKYLFSGGTVGFFEDLRPLVLPLILGLIWKLGISPVAFGTGLEILIGAATIFMTYRIGTRLFNKGVGTIAALILAFLPIFIEYSSRVLTGIPSTLLALVAVDLFISRKYAWAGVLAGLAFLTRFPQGIVVASFVIIFAYAAVASYPKVQKAVMAAAMTLAGFFATVIPYFIFNLIFYKDVTANAKDALFRPFLLAFSTIEYSNAWVYQGSRLFYFTELLKENALLIFAAIGLWYIIAKKLYRKERYLAVLLPLILLFSYFTYTQHKELRFALSFLPYLAILAGAGIGQVFHLMRKKLKPSARAFAIALVMFLIIAGMVVALVRTERMINWMPKDERPIMGFYTYPQGMEGFMFTTDPLMAVYNDLPMAAGFYFDIGVYEYRTHKNEITIAAFSTRSYLCEDPECVDRKNRFLLTLFDDMDLAYWQRYNGDDYFIFTKDGPKLDENEVLKELNITLSRRVEMLPNPGGKELMVLFRADNAAGLYTEDGKGNIWKADNFRRLNDLFEEKGVPLLWLIVPAELPQLNYESLQYVKETLKDPLFSVAQHGYAHANNGDLSEFTGLGYQEQLDMIKHGKALIYQYLGVEPEVFVPPFNRGNEDTARAAEEAGFKAYSSVWNDWTETDLLRLDEKVNHVESWSPLTLQDAKSMEEAITDYMTFEHDYVVVDLAYYYMEDKDFQELSDLLDYINGRDDMQVASFDEMISWYSRDVEFEHEGEVIRIDSDDPRPITLSFVGSGNYTLEGTYFENGGSVLLKNGAHEDITICLNETCSMLVR